MNSYWHVTKHTQTSQRSGVKMIVYSNSCSFGVKQEHPVYAELVADEFNASLVNAGQPGACNRRIIRSSLRDLIDLKKQNKKVLCLLGLSFITRTELWQPLIPALANDGNFHPIIVDYAKFNWTQGLVDTQVNDIHLAARDDVQDYYKQWLLHMSKEAIVTDTVADIIMFKECCIQNDINVLIWSNTQIWPAEPEVATSNIFLKDFVEHITADRHIIDPWKFSFQQYAIEHGHRPKDESSFGLSGHPNKHAHKDFANYLINYIKQKEIL